MGLEPTHVSVILGEWVDAQRHIEATLIAWHDVQNHDNLKTWVDATHAAEELCEQLELPFDLLMEADPWDTDTLGTIVKTARKDFHGE